MGKISLSSLNYPHLEEIALSDKDENMSLKAVGHLIKAGSLASKSLFRIARTSHNEAVALMAFSALVRKNLMTAEYLKELFSNSMTRVPIIKIKAEKHILESPDSSEETLKMIACYSERYVSAMRALHLLFQKKSTQKDIFVSVCIATENKQIAEEAFHLMCHRYRVKLKDLKTITSAAHIGEVALLAMNKITSDPSLTSETLSWIACHANHEFIAMVAFEVLIERKMITEKVLEKIILHTDFNSIKFKVQEIIINYPDVSVELLHHSIQYGSSDRISIETEKLLLKREDISYSILSSIKTSGLTGENIRTAKEILEKPEWKFVSEYL